jgi:sugar phosphate isomerase/epimerase
MHLAAPGGAGPDLGHLTYCTNIHAGEPLAEVMASLARHLPAIKSQVAPGQPFGVGLRLGAAAATSLAEAGALAQLKRFLAEGGYYVFSLNGFPYGAFHGRAVKEDAYKPDWSDPARLDYTNRLADILSELLPAGQEGSVSTVPCTFKPWAPGRLEAITEHLLRHVAHLVGIAARTGQAISLALEPEPYCYLETIEETVAFFKERLFAREGVARLAALTGLAVPLAEAAMRRHIGVCYDVCHAAVEFEDPAASVARLRAEGILIGKLQLSSALRIASLDAASARQLAAFAEPVYLHQAVQKSGGALVRYVDLPQALAPGGAPAGAELRVHFHVPVFLEKMEHFGTTQAFLAQVLAQHRAQPISKHLEVETYTWDVLPEAYRTAELSAAIARELDWVKAQLLAPQRAAA